ncbi:MAG: hypothetical protein VX589_09315 [Myxococcota bacterium]|nr:hypothetical protein [Myxococcota bacterium]
MSERIDRLLASAKRARMTGQAQSAIELLQTVLQLDPEHEGALRLMAVVSNDLQEEAGEASVAWNVQYAAGADESIDEPPPLAMDIFDADAESLDDSFISGSYQSQPDHLSGTTGMNNPSTDPYRMSANKFSTIVSAGEDKQGLLEPASSKVVTLKTLPSVNRRQLEDEWETVDTRRSKPPVTPRRPVESAPNPAIGTSTTQSGEAEGESLIETLSDRDGFRAQAPPSGSVFLIDTFDEEVDDDASDAIEERLQLAVRRHDAGDYVASQALVERILDDCPSHAVAERLQSENQRHIQAAQVSKLGALSHCPRVKLRQQEVVWQSLNHHEGFMISLVDGQTPYESIIEISAMPRAEAIKILSRLVQLGVIG